MVSLLSAGTVVPGWDIGGAIAGTCCFTKLAECISSSYGTMGNKSTT
jgi:hypothetical protein